MQGIGGLSGPQLKEIKTKADLLLSEKHRGYLPGRMLAMLLGKYRDDVTEALGLPVPPLPRRDGQLRKAGLDEMTLAELAEATQAVLLLVNHTGTMDDPALPVYLREYRDALIAQKRERDRIQEGYAERHRLAAS